MGFTTITQSTKVLNFLPRQEWKASLPPVLWRDFVVGGFVRAQVGQGAIAMPADLDLPTVIYELYGQLKLPEMARLFMQIKDCCPEQQQGFFSVFGWRETEDLIELMSIMVALPISFQRWCEDREMGSRDLAPLRLLIRDKNNSADLTLIHQDLEHFVELSPSKNIGAKILEYYSEILLMGQSVRLRDFKCDADLSLHLSRLRHPMAFASEEKKRRQLKALPWPVGVQSRLERRGDESQVEVKFSYRNPSELKEKLSLLHRLAEKMDSQ